MMIRYITIILSLFLSGYLFALNTDERIEELFGEVKPYKVFFTQFQEAVKNNNPTEVSKYINYPLHEGDSILAKDKSEFIKKYHAIFTTEVRTAVLNQQYKNIFANYQGIMFGNGQVWFADVCGKSSTVDHCKKGQDVRVIAVNRE